MADMMDTLKGLLGDNADEKLSGIMSILNAEKPDNETEEFVPADEPSENPVGITPEMLSAAQALMSRMSSSGDSDRTRLLMSLKPYMSKSRRDSIDSAVKMLNMAEMSKFFKEVM